MSFGAPRPRLRRRTTSFEKVEQSQADDRVAQQPNDKVDAGRAEVELGQRAAQSLEAPRDRDRLGGRGGADTVPKERAELGEQRLHRLAPPATYSTSSAVGARGRGARASAADILATMELALLNGQPVDRRRRPTPSLPPIGGAATSVAAAATVPPPWRPAPPPRAGRAGASARERRKYSSLSQQSRSCQISRNRKNFARSRPHRRREYATRPGGTRARASSGSRAASAVSAGASKSGGATHARTRGGSRARSRRKSYTSEMRQRLQAAAARCGVTRIWFPREHGR